MSVQGRRAKQFPPHLEARLLANVDTIDRTLVELGSASSVEQLRMALDAIRGAAVMLDDIELVRVAETLAAALEIVLVPPRLDDVDAVSALRTIAETLRDIVGSPNAVVRADSVVAPAEQALGALRQIRAVSLRTVVAADEDQPLGAASAMGPTLFAESAHHLSLIRAAADELARGGERETSVRRALRSLHALKGACAVSGFADIRESCHRSEDRIQRLATANEDSVFTLIAEMRLAVDSIDELLEEYRRSRAIVETVGGADTDTGIQAAALRDAAGELRGFADSIERIANDLLRQSGPAFDAERDVDLTRMQALLDTLATSLPKIRARQAAGRAGADAFAVLGERLRVAFEALSRAAGKPAELEVEAGRTAITQDAANALYDPLLQLLRNAIDHGIEAGPDRLQAGKPQRGSVLLRAFRREHETIIEVFDDGAGISPWVVRDRAGDLGFAEQAVGPDDASALRLIFEPGFTLRGVVDIGSGRGIGLDLVRSTVEGLGGDVAVASTPGIGTCFRLTLPDRTNPVLDDHAIGAGTPVRAYQQRTVLVVDDSVGVRRILGQTLQRHGWRTVQARDGVEALNVLDAELPDVLITDIEMPALDGYELIRAVRGRSGWADLPIIVMTSRVSDLRDVPVPELDADVCLGKPFDEAELVAALALALQLRGVETPMIEQGEPTSECAFELGYPTE